MSTLFNAGDFQRLDRERTLTEQAPRQLPAEDRTPPDGDGFDNMIDGIIEALTRRLQNE